MRNPEQVKRFKWVAQVAALALLGTLAPGSGAAVFWLDDRVPYEQATPEERDQLLDAVGGIECTDGTTGTGFVVNIDNYVDGEPDFQIIATTARVLFDWRTGQTRGDCAFRPATMPEKYLRLGDRLAGAARTKSMDPNDWAFARLEQSQPLPQKLRVFFADAHTNFPVIERELWAAGYVRLSGQVSISSQCQATKPSTSQRDIAESERLLIHNCDILGSSRGGPLAIREDGRFYVVAIHAGEGQEDRYGDLSSIPFDPQRNFFNYSRRLDKDLEEKLVAFVSRFAYVKSPTLAIKEERILVRNIQDYLNRLGFDAGKVDGLSGRRTGDAIRAFQTTIGVTPTGNVSEELLVILKSK